MPFFLNVIHTFIKTHAVKFDTMVVSKSAAKERYRTGITEFGGASQYEECGQKKEQGFLSVAECLENASVAALTTESMVRRYGKAA